MELFFGPTARDTHAFGTLRDTAQALRRLALAGAERPVQLLDAVGRINDLARRVLGLGTDSEISAGHLHRLGSLALIVSPDRLGSEAALASFRADMDAALGSDSDSDSDADGDRNSDADGEDPAPRDGIDARRARPLTTRDYTVVDNRGDGVLFRRPGETRGDWRTPRAFDRRADPPEFAVSVQDYA
ncbi:hypothetical protein AB4212_60255, partial [Streptomyces sp. 2MCAF27]